MNAKNDPNTIEARDEQTPTTPTTDAGGMADVTSDELKKVDGGRAVAVTSVYDSLGTRTGPGSYFRK